VPEGRLSSAGAVSRQRADIASVQTRLMGRLTTTSHRLFHRHQTVPLLTLEVGPAALAELTAASLYVEKITEDGLSAPAAAPRVPLTQTPPGGTGGFDGTGWMVAILDTGVDTTHPFIGRKVVEPRATRARSRTRVRPCVHTVRSSRSVRDPASTA
jgi:hypothetical protein